LQSETVRFYHKLLSIRLHEFQTAGFGFVVEGVSQLKFDEEWVYYYIAQTDLNYEIFSSECVQRRADHVLEGQRMRCDELPIFLPLPEEIRQFIKQSLSKTRRKHYILRRINFEKRR